MNRRKIAILVAMTPAALIPIMNALVRHGAPDAVLGLLFGVALGLMTLGLIYASKDRCRENDRAQD